MQHALDNTADDFAAGVFFVVERIHAHRANGNFIGIRLQHNFTQIMPKFVPTFAINHVRAARFENLTFARLQTITPKKNV